MRIFDRNTRRQHDDDETAPLDPVAVTLAVWLGLIVAVTGLIRLSQNAAYVQQQRQQGTTLVTPAAIAMQFAPYGT